MRLESNENSIEILFLYQIAKSIPARSLHCLTSIFGRALRTAGSCPVSWLPMADLILRATLCSLATLPVLLIAGGGLVSPSLSSSSLLPLSSPDFFVFRADLRGHMEELCWVPGSDSLSVEICELNSLKLCLGEAGAVTESQA